MLQKCAGAGSSRRHAGLRAVTWLRKIKGWRNALAGVPGCRLGFIRSEGWIPPGAQTARQFRTRLMQPEGLSMKFPERFLSVLAFCAAALAMTPASAATGMPAKSKEDAQIGQDLPRLPHEGKPRHRHRVEEKRPLRQAGGLLQLPQGQGRRQGRGPAREGQGRQAGLHHHHRLAQDLRPVPREGSRPAAALAPCQGRADPGLAGQHHGRGHRRPRRGERRLPPVPRRHGHV